MSIKILFWGLLVALLVSMGWHYFGHGDASAWLGSSKKSLPAIEFNNDGPAGGAGSGGTQSGAPADLAASGQAAHGGAAGGMRKCRKGATIVYTDGECPAGSHEQAMGGGSVTIVKGQQTQHVPDSAASIPNARDLLMKPEDADLKEKRMDQIINR